MATRIYQAFLDHLKLREGYRDNVYLDTLGNPTCGVGHVLTSEEQTKFATGDVVKANVIDNWLSEDAQNAWFSAIQQLNDLGLNNLDFLLALGSVNFQLGTNWKNKFPSAYKALKDRNYEEAISQISTGSGTNGQSKWKEQTPVRVEDFINAINKLITEQER